MGAGFGSHAAARLCIGIFLFAAQEMAFKSFLKSRPGDPGTACPSGPWAATLPAQARPGEDVRGGWLLVLTTRVPTEGSRGSLTPDPSDAAAAHEH